MGIKIQDEEFWKTKALGGILAKNGSGSTRLSVRGLITGSY
jgi:hypothetical protein